jgi:hypothetical protein
MKKQLTSIFLVLTISACTNTITTSSEEKVDQNKELTAYNPAESYFELLWVEKADPSVDALKAIKQGDDFLWAYRTRVGSKIPGIDEDSLVLIREKYKLKLAPAMGDVGHGSRHLELQLKFIDYAKEYNRIIINN